MNRRSFVASCLGSAAGLAVKPAPGCATKQPIELAWTVREYVDGASQMRVIRYSACCRLPDKDAAIPNLPPIKSGFFRERIDRIPTGLCCGKMTYIKIDVIDKQTWLDALAEASEEARKNSIAELPFPVELNPFPGKFE